MNGGGWLVARIDDYKESFRLAAQELKEANLPRVSKLAGVDAMVGDKGVTDIKVPFMGVDYLVRVGKDVDVVRDGPAGDIPLPEKILICHYLLCANGKSPTGDLITFRQIPDGHFYFDAFQRRARDPFLSAFGRDAELFRACALVLGGIEVETGDVAMSFRPFPRISMQLVLWQGDEELPPEAGILFDSSIQDSLSAEDIAVLSGMLVYRLMGIARSRQSQSHDK
jgi:hypothetical protein